MDYKEICFQPGWKIAKAVQRGEVSAMNVAEAFVERIDSLNPVVRAWTSLDREYCLRQAHQIDQTANKGMLAGVPVGVKDIFNTEVYPTQMGSSIWKGHKAGNDARCVSYLRRESGLIAGKTDTAEFAVHTPNQALNPWNVECVPGTSSAGSAVAVATAMVPMALSTQTAGSTIRPASWCGVYGMKPSFGVIPRTGVLKTTDTLDNIGFYGRDPADLNLLLDVMRVRGENYPVMERAFLRKKETPLSKWRIAFIRGHFWNDAEDYTRSAMEKLAQEMAEVPEIDLIELELPSKCLQAHELHRRIYNPCLAYYFRDELEKAPHLISERFMELVEDGRKISPEDYRVALEEQTLMAGEVESFFKTQEVDFIIHFSSQGSAPFGTEPLLNKDLNPLWTLLWLPVVNVPHFFSPQGMPFGFQLIGSRYSDYRLFEFLDCLVREGLAPASGPIALH